jgi:hypothetical protein
LPPVRKIVSLASQGVSALFFLEVKKESPWSECPDKPGAPVEVAREKCLGGRAVELNLAAIVIASALQKFPWAGHFNGASLWAMECNELKRAVRTPRPQF